MTLYHVTSKEAAIQIANEGFVESDFHGIAMGVFLSDRPLDAGDGVALAADVIFVVTVPDDFDVHEYEVIEEGRPADAYREWLVPASLVNSWPREILINAE